MEPTPAAVMLSKYGLAPSRRRGQNFLVDGNVARKVAAAVNAGPEDVVVEIGAGFGAITFGLAETARHVVAIEYDSGIARAFREEYGDTPTITLMNEDVLEFDLRAVAHRFAAPKLVVAGNLPYNVTSPVIRRLIENKDVVARAVLMVQKEVAARIAAGAGETDYSALSAVTRFHAVVRLLFTVRRTCFHPRPRVDSRIVEIDLAAAPERRCDPGVYSDVVHAAFGKRRKMLRQSLEALARLKGVGIPALAERAGIDLSRRGETLSIGEFERLAVVLGRGSG